MSSTRTVFLTEGGSFIMTKRSGKRPYNLPARGQKRLIFLIPPVS